MLLLVYTCMSTHSHLLYFARFCAGSTPKIANKNIEQRTLPEWTAFVVSVMTIVYETNAKEKDLWWFIWLLFYRRKQLRLCGTTKVSLSLQVFVL